MSDDVGSTEGRILRGYVRKPNVMDGLYSVVALMTAGYWLLAFITIDGTAYLITSALAIVALLVTFGAWTYHDRRLKDGE